MGSATRQKEVFETANCQQGGGRSLEKPHRLDLTNSEERVEPYGYAYREGWLRQWGFPFETHEHTQNALYGLSGDFNKHKPRISEDCFEPLAHDDSWRKLTPKQKLLLVLEFHTRVAPYDWWRDYFIRLDRSALGKGLPCFHRTNCTCFSHHSS